MNRFDLEHPFFDLINPDEQVPSGKSVDQFTERYLFFLGQLSDSELLNREFTSEQIKEIRNHYEVYSKAAKTYHLLGYRENGDPIV